MSDKKVLIIIEYYLTTDDMTDEEFEKQEPYKLEVTEEMLESLIEREVAFPPKHYIAQLYVTKK